MSLRVRPARPLAPIAVAAGDPRHLVVGGAQRRGRVGAGARRPGLRDALSSGIVGPGVVLARAKVTMVTAPHGWHRRAAASRSVSTPRHAYAPGRWSPAGEEAFIGPVGGQPASRRPASRCVPDAPGGVRRRDAGHRHRGAVRPAVVDPPDRASAAGDRSTSLPAGDGPDSLALRDHEDAGEAATGCSRMRASPGARVRTAPATAGVRSTGGRRPTPES